MQASLARASGVDGATTSRNGIAIAQRGLHCDAGMTPLAGWGRVPTVEGEEHLGESLEQLPRGEPDARPRPLVRRRVAAGHARTTSSSARGSPTASSPSTKRPACCAPRPGSRLRRARTACSCRAASSRRSRRARKFVTLGGMVASRRARQEPPRRRLLRRARARAAHAPRRRQRSSSAARRASRELFCAHARRHGPDRPHPRGRARSCERIAAPWIVTESERAARHRRRFIDGARRGAAAWPYDHGLDRRLARGAQPRARHRSSRAAGPRPTRRRRDAAARRRTTPRRCRSMLPQLGRSNRVSVRAVQQLFYCMHRWRPRARHRAPRQLFFYPLDAHPALEPPATARAASRSTSACCRAAAPRRLRALLRDADAARGGASFLWRDQGLRRRGRGLLSFPLPGIVDRARHAVPARHPGARRRAQRARDRGRRAHLPRPRTRSRAPSTSRRWSRGSPRSSRCARSGIRSGGCAARSRCACSEIAP